MPHPTPQSLQTPATLSHVPAPLRPLIDLAFNFWWTWSADAADVFAWINPKLWERTQHNPVQLLAEVGGARLGELAADPSFVGAVASAWQQLDNHYRNPGWFSHRKPMEIDQSRRPFLAAYFCAEFGLTECFQIYSGGLGLLAGDHLKSAAGLALPLVGVGLLYRCGYFHQSLTASGEQVELYPEMDFTRQPVRQVRGADGSPIRVYFDLPGRRVHVAIWCSEVGRVPLYLLDTNLPENTSQDCNITRSLYLGDHDMRIRQEIVLGIGGVRALAALGIEPTVCHMNEGHSAFMALERTRLLREKHSLTFDQAREATASGHVFTTHTPVPAGIDRFSPLLVTHYFQNYHEQLGLDLEGFLALGRENVADKSESFSMAVLAIRLSRFANGVSRLHGRVSRGMWKNIWPGTPCDDVPIGHVTNGVNAPGWIGPRVAEILETATGKSWRENSQDDRAWERVDAISDADLWRCRQESRQALVQWCRVRVKERLISHGASDLEIAAVAKLLHPDVLTVGFARRFAAYKRGTLLFRDPQRILKLIRGDRPVQFIIAGKSHPGDPGGKQLIRDIIQFARTHKVDDRIVFLEDYDIEIARQLVRGCDAWLNTPIRGLEASGTSGMKAAMNGVINLSTLDGWWDEGFNTDVGYHIESIGTFDHDMPNDQREDFESNSLYRLLEHQLVPEFYERDAVTGIPSRWTSRVRQCIRQLAPRFNTHRMLVEYATQYYFPAHNALVRMEADGCTQAKAVSDHIDLLREHWPKVRVIGVQSEPGRGRPIMDVSAVVELGELKPDDVSIQLCHGQLDSHGELMQVENLPMKHEKDLHDGAHRYTVRFTPTRTPREAWVVRVLPHHKSMVHPYVPGLIVSGTLQRAQAHLETHV